MPEKSLKVPIQYVLLAEVKTFARPYDLKEAITNSIEMWLNTEALPQADHWRLVLEAKVTGAQPDGTVCIVASCAIEAIVVTGGLEPDEVTEVLGHMAAPSVMGSIRTQLALLTQGTGLGTVILPPFSAEAIAALPPKPL
jgi:preprotein translocase subunit SecB